jgi:hypothetical protein
MGQQGTPHTRVHRPQRRVPSMGKRAKPGTFSAHDSTLARTVQAQSACRRERSASSSRHAMKRPRERPRCLCPRVQDETRSGIPSQALRSCAWLPAFRLLQLRKTTHMPRPITLGRQLPSVTRKECGRLSIPIAVNNRPRPSFLNSKSISTPPGFSRPLCWAVQPKVCPRGDTSEMQQAATNASRPGMIPRRT